MAKVISIEIYRARKMVKEYYKAHPDFKKWRDELSKKLEHKYKWATTRPPPDS